MNSREINQMNTFTTIDAVLRTHKESVETIPALNNAVIKFRASLDELTRDDQLYTTGVAGLTASKNSTAEAMTSHILKVSNALYVYGRNTGNEELKTECRIKPSDLAHPRDVELQRQCERTIELARAHGTELVAYGIAAADIESLAAELSVYRKQREEQQVKTAESKASRKRLYASFAETADILKEELDPLLELFETTNVEFYTNYKAARIVKDLGGHTGKSAKPASTPQSITETVSTAAAGA